MHEDQTSEEYEEVKQGRSMDLSDRDIEALRSELRDSVREFANNGGRSVDLAEFIDCARYELRRRSAVKAAATRKKNKLAA